MRPLLSAIVLLAACEHPSHEPVTPPSPPAATTAFDAQIAALATIDAAGIGFSPSMSGAQFLPVATSDDQGALLLGQPPPQRSVALANLVAGGAAAVPALLGCLDNATPTHIPPMKAMEWTEHTDAFDINRRTTKRPPGPRHGDPEVPVEHVVTVGDLCFVALGQIVNRSFSAVRYQPTGGLVISSPPESPALRKALRDEWGTLTRASLRASLIRDFEEPDYDQRRLGAVVRLAYYEPDAVKPVVDAELAKPTYDGMGVDELARSLYGESTAQRAHDFAAYVAAHGVAARDGIENALFEDLSTQEAYEQKRVSPASSGSTYRARECLVELFNLPAAVTSTDRPYPSYASQTERQRLVEALATVPHR